eukprot:TRINITY_DN421_c0_g2_i1.p1 TRINITY_DN421_c0_g2~~TRINITY_DN421_c0_g2_i1.p1  ORF type:complete len:231 (+),score=62.27 TRINITY_DN421_c0_g2_i1:86-778(+)
MSKFKVHAVLDGATRSIELDRRNFKFNDLRSKVAQKFGTNTFHLIYNSPRGNSFDISDDSSLQQAVKDALSGKARFLNVKVGGAPSGTKPPTQASVPHAQQGSQKNTSSAAPAHHGGGGGHSGSGGGHSGSGGSLASVKVSGTPSGADKVSVKYDQHPDHFFFTIHPSVHDTSVQVVLADPKKLQFVSTWSFQDGPVIRQMQAAQSFTLPFEVTPNLISVSGNHVKLIIP